MDHPRELADVGLFNTRYTAFLETVVHLRPRLHRYCARMTGSVLDGEDVMQEALFEAYRKLEQFDETRPLKPWLFRIAHNRCIDFLRRRGAHVDVDAHEDPAIAVSAAADLPGLRLGLAVERLVIHLPPKERACVLLKDVFDDSLDEIAKLIDSTVGGVKAALHRGRGKLARLQEPELLRAPADLRSAGSAHASELTLADARLLQLYIERFNQRDWAGLRALISADARLQVADCFAGRLADSPYFVEYERADIPWRMVLGEIDGEPAVVSLRDAGAGFVPAGAIRVERLDGRIVRIADYFKCPWVLPTATTLWVNH